MSEPEIICLAGKNDIATWCLEELLQLGWPREKIVGLPNQNDEGKHTWQYSLRRTLQEHSIREISLKEAEELENCLFLSVEFDRIIRVSKFKSDRIFNIHFSKLPEYRGVSTSVWPLLQGRKVSGVTLHRIDPGIDTGEIIDQKEIEIGHDWTARDLYQEYLERGTDLIVKNLPSLISNTLTSSPQNSWGATYYGRHDLDYKNPPRKKVGTSFQVHNGIRAFVFPEYQLPEVDGIPILRSGVTDTPSRGKPGTLTKNSEWTGTITTLDFDVSVTFDVYAPLYKWAGSGDKKPSEDCFDYISDWNRIDTNGWTLLMVAAWNGSQEAIDKFVECGADVNFSNKRGTTPLMYAASYAEKTGCMDPVYSLLEHGADLHATDRKGLSLLEHLKKRNSREVLNKILSKGN